MLANGILAIDNKQLRHDPWKPPNYGEKLKEYRETMDKKITSLIDEMKAKGLI